MDGGNDRIVNVKKKKKRRKKQRPQNHKNTGPTNKEKFEELFKRVNNLEHALLSLVSITKDDLENTGNLDVLKQAVIQHLIDKTNVNIQKVMNS